MNKKSFLGVVTCIVQTFGKKFVYFLMLPLLLSCGGETKQDLRDRIDDLESQVEELEQIVQEKDDRIEELEEKLSNIQSYAEDVQNAIYNTHLFGNSFGDYDDVEDGTQSILDEADY